MNLARLALVAFVALLAAGCGLVRAPATRPEVRGCDPSEVARPGQLLPLCISTDYGPMSVEGEYVPGVVQCEVGGFRQAPAALEAQAIVARTYLLAHLTRNGPEARVPLTSVFQCWKVPVAEEVLLAANRTRDLVLHRHGEVLDANYAAGTSKREDDCAPKAPSEAGYDEYDTWEAMREAWVAARKAGRRLRFSGVAWTELLVTRNEGRTGLAVEPTPFAPARPTNRGAFGQWAAVCLARKRGYGAEEIVKYFFGEDVELSRPLETNPAVAATPRS